MNVVTGAFGYSGKYIAQLLLERGERVRTITTHPDKPNPFGPIVEAFPFNFQRPDLLEASLRGASTLYNTYWVRFDHGDTTFQRAIENTATLFACARRAGVSKIVHISVTNPSADSELPYYRGKWQLEKLLKESGVPYSIVRPTLLFGKEDILVNNIAWLLRTFPLFPIFGSGQYRVQPVYVGDMARIAIASAGNPQSVTLDAIGPETFTFQGMVELMAAKIKPNARIVHVPPALGITLGKAIGLALRDIILTRDELQGLMDNLLTSSQPVNGTTLFSDWLEEHRAEVGCSYSSELARHFRWRQA